VARVRQLELRNAGLLAAREARGVLARAVDVLETEAAGGAYLANDVVLAIGKLYACELGDAHVVLKALREVSGILSSLLAKLHDPTAGIVADDAGALAAKSLAILYPLRTGLERALAEPEAEVDDKPIDVPRFSEAPPTLVDEAPLLLTRTRSKPPSMVPPANTGHERRDQERRDQERVALEVDIGLHSATQFYAGISGDISEGGLFISTVKLFPIGTDLTVSFVLPSGIAITTLGTVAWHAQPRDEQTKPGMGVRFSRLAQADHEAIDAFLKRRPALLHDEA
jgi:uncharacterized protein (TIGR02266 family)